MRVQSCAWHLAPSSRSVVRGWAVKKELATKPRPDRQCKRVGRLPPYTTTAPDRGGHSHQVGCAVTMAERERERNGIHRGDR